MNLQGRTRSAIRTLGMKGVGVFDGIAKIFTGHLNAAYL